MIAWFAFSCTTTPVSPEPHTSIVGSTLATTPRNLLMISIDTTRRDYIDRYATDGVTRTPFLAQLLSEGVALDDHQQCSNWTYASTSCTLEGRLNEDTGWMAKLALDTRSPVPDGRRTLAVRLAEQGWYSILVSSNGWLTGAWNNAQGYSIVRRETTDDTTLLLEAAQTQLESAVVFGHTPWFLHIHLIEAHPAYTPSDPYDDATEALPPIPWDLDSQVEQYDAAFEWPEMTEQERDLLVRHLQARYTGELQQQDAALATWWAEMDRKGWLDDTLVVFWTDHGEQFFEHGNQAHAYSLAAEENDAVMGLWAKDMTPLAWDGPTHAIDLVPTVLDALEVPIEEDGTLDGFIVGAAPSDRARFASSVSRLQPVLSVTKGGVKLQYSFDGSMHLWDRNTDRAELVDRYIPTDPLSIELWSLLRPRVELVASLSPEWSLIWPEGL